MAQVTWTYSIYAYAVSYEPENVEIWRYVLRQAELEPLQQDFTFLFYKDPLWTDFQIEVISVSFDENTFSKHTRISFLDTVTGERVYYDDYVTVPPFNGQSPYGELLHIQTHQTPAPPPPPPQPPPSPPPPIPILPPEGPPIERPLRPPDEPPFEPPDKPPPIFMPPDRPPPPRLTNDFLVWNAFVQRYGDQIRRWALEVPLDWGDRLPSSVPENYRALWERLTTHKADAFIDMGRFILVAELKPRLTLACLGQAYFGYQLALRRYRFDKPVFPACIVATAPQSLLPIANANGIRVYVLEQITGEPIEGGD